MNPLSVDCVKGVDCPRYGANDLSSALPSRWCCELHLV